VGGGEGFVRDEENENLTPIYKKSQIEIRFTRTMTLLQCHTILFNLFLLACEGNENESPGKSKRKQTIRKP
jgi:hypothetical protein